MLAVRRRASTARRRCCHSRRPSWPTGCTAALNRGNPSPSSGCSYRRPTGVSDRSAFRRRRHSAASSSDDLGFVVVTHPFHPLNGQRLEVLYVKRRVEATVFVCSGGVSGQITLPSSWTNRGQPAGRHRLSVQGLAELLVTTRAIESR